MFEHRLIPVLLLYDNELYKTRGFGSPQYVGDPINAVRIFNEKEVDELIILDITASRQGKEPNYSLLERLASECFIPITYGGGVNSLEMMRVIFAFGVEKIALNASLLDHPELVQAAVSVFGSQSIVAAVNFKRRSWPFKYGIYDYRTRRFLKTRPSEYMRFIESLNVGEILITDVDREGSYQGFDEALFDELAQGVSNPVIGCGGARDAGDCLTLLRNTRVDAVAAGSMFVFHGKHRAVLITYPSKAEFDELARSRGER